MIENLVINQEQGRLEYTMGDETVCNDKVCYNTDKLKVYEIMLKVIENWNANNPTLPL